MFQYFKDISIFSKYKNVVSGWLPRINDIWSPTFRPFPLNAIKKNLHKNCVVLTEKRIEIYFFSIDCKLNSFVWIIAEIEWMHSHSANVMPNDMSFDVILNHQNNRNSLRCKQWIPIKCIRFLAFSEFICEMYYFLRIIRAVFLGKLESITVLWIWTCECIGIHRCLLLSIHYGLITKNEISVATLLW